MDYIASRGFSILGFEIKSHRGDWLNELKKPEKAEGIAPYCDEWWIVASENVVKIEEVPKAWGWFTPYGQGLRVLKRPEKTETIDIDRPFLMSIMKKGYSYILFLIGALLVYYGYLSESCGCFLCDKPIRN